MAFSRIGGVMKLRTRIWVTVLWNLALFFVPWTLYQVSRFVMLWGAYRGYWDAPYWEMPG